MVKTISPKDAFEKIKSKKAFVVDIREPEFYKESHVTTAVSLPMYGVNADALLKILPKDKSADVVVACYSGNTSKVMAREIEKLGYANTFSLDGGTNGWIAAGFPVESG